MTKQEIHIGEDQFIQDESLDTRGTQWFFACEVSMVPENGGVCVKYDDKQIALFRFTRLDQWFATQNECPHRQQMALSRGMIGTQNDEPKVACPFHKKTFSLVSGACLQGDQSAIEVYDVMIRDEKVYISVNPKKV
jgi:nitrite reductase (NADH) small subunit